MLARSDGLWYRVRKFAARNAIAVGAAGAVLAAVVVGASVAAWQARVAVAEKRRAEQVKELIASVFREADPTQVRGRILSAADLLRQAERRVHDRPDVSPATQLELLAIVGESLFGLQENADAARVVEQALKLQDSSRIDDDLLQARLRLVLSQAYEILGRHEEAKRELTSLLRSAEDVRQIPPAGCSSRRRCSSRPSRSCCRSMRMPSVPPGRRSTSPPRCWGRHHPSWPPPFSS